MGSIHRALIITVIIYCSLKIYMEACRSGHNGTDLKSAVAHAPGVRIPLPPPLNINLHSKVPIIGSIPKITGWLLLSAGLTYNKMHKVVPI